MYLLCVYMACLFTWLICMACVFMWFIYVTCVIFLCLCDFLSCLWLHWICASVSLWDRGHCWAWGLQPRNGQGQGATDRSGVSAAATQDSRAATRLAAGHGPVPLVDLTSGTGAGRKCFRDTPHGCREPFPRTGDLPHPAGCPGEEETSSVPTEPLEAVGHGVHSTWSILGLLSHMAGLM